MECWIKVTRGDVGVVVSSESLFRFGYDDTGKRWSMFLKITHISDESGNT